MVVYYTHNITLEFLSWFKTQLHSLVLLAKCKSAQEVSFCTGCILTNTRLLWGDPGMGIAITCTRCSQVVGLIQRSGEAPCARSLLFKVVAIVIFTCFSNTINAWCSCTQTLEVMEILMTKHHIPLAHTCPTLQSILLVILIGKNGRNQSTKLYKLFCEVGELQHQLPHHCSHFFYYTHILSPIL